MTQALEVVVYLETYLSMPAHLSNAWLVAAKVSKTFSSNVDVIVHLLRALEVAVYPETYLSTPAHLSNAWLVAAKVSKTFSLDADVTAHLSFIFLVLLIYFGLIPQVAMSLLMLMILFSYLTPNFLTSHRQLNSFTGLSFLHSCVETIFAVSVH
ncbi:hypothetical protein B0H10DRAFT_2186510 [Mycena sp. CBHHK59/15]|nr:hypothetical protein B0H10DRAFT_2186510 [Mycena sp. CBHHK59/15]